MNSQTDTAALAADLTRDEGLRLYVYDDASGAPIRPGSVVRGHPTIGVGRCLDTHGLSAVEAEFLLAADIEAAGRRLAQALKSFAALTPARQRVLIEMAFNLGVGGLLGFRTMLDAIAAGRFEAAADEMLASRWAQQVGGRALRLAALMRAGA